MTLWDCSGLLIHYDCEPEGVYWENVRVENLDIPGAAIHGDD